MGNGYYIPPGEAPLTGFTRNVMALAEMKQRGDQFKAEQLTQQERMAQGNAAIEADKRQQDFTEKKFKLENPHLDNYSANDNVELVSAFGKMGLKNSSFIKESENWMMNPEVTKGEAYMKIRGKHKDFVKEVSDFMISNKDKPGFQGSEQEANLRQVLEFASTPEGYGEIVDQFFPTVAPIYRAQEAEAAKKNAAGEPKNEFQVFMEGMREIDPNVSNSKIAEEWRKRQIETSKEKTQISVNLRGIAGGSDADSFRNWTTEEKRFHFDQYLANGTRPSFAPRDISGRRAFDREVAHYATGKGIDGNDIQLNKADYGALKGSLNFQQKSYNMASSFANNLNHQMDKVDKLMAELDRTGIRAVDLPWRKLKTRFVGSGREQELESYLMEISREIGKLSTGSQASVAELSVGAQEKWDKVHDPNLSLPELKKVLNATRDQANMRMKSLRDEIAKTRTALKNVGKVPGAEGSTGSPLVDYLSANKTQYGQKQLYEAAKKAGWKHQDIIDAWRSMNGR
ncbi:MAG TPA: hypothetical protein VLL97_13095 [Acidobacteriota bacterium]|nr:hypothetical protein [Acidobacteriota bacterium]